MAQAGKQGDGEQCLKFGPLDLLQKGADLRVIEGEQFFFLNAGEHTGGCWIGSQQTNEHSLLQAVEAAVELNLSGDLGIPVPDYVEENVSTKVVKIIQSYTGVVNKMVWRKF